MKPNLALLIYSLGPGGAERVVSLLLPALRHHYNVHLVLMNLTQFYAIPEEITVHYIEHSDPGEAGLVKLLKLPLLAWRYARYCRKHHITISLSFMTRPNYIALLAKALGFGGKVVINERATPSLQYGYRDLASWINRRLIRTLYPHADTVMANSGGNAEDLRKYFGIPQTIRVLHNPCDLETIEALKKEQAPGFPTEKRFTMISVGRMDTGKNHRMLIDAFVLSKMEGSRLIFIGDGPLRSELETYVRELGYTDTILFVGHQPNPYAWLVRADCFVFGSNHEGFPNVLLEALACGLPVISTDCPSGPREILEVDGDVPYGILVPVGDTKMMAEMMQRIRSDEALRDHYAKRATIRANAFALAPFTSHFIKVLDQILHEE